MQDMEEIYKQYSQTVYKYIFCLTDNEEISKEITQETFAVAVQRINKFRGECKISVWLCQIAKYIWYKELKKNKKIEFEKIENIEDTRTVEDIIIQKEEKLQIFKEIRKLDNNTKEVMYLRLIGNLSFLEIAEVMGKTPNWARVTYYRGKQKIKEEKENGEKK